MEAEAKAEEKKGKELVQVIGSDDSLADQGKQIAKLMTEINLDLLKPILGERLERAALFCNLRNRSSQ